MTHSKYAPFHWRDEPDHTPDDHAVLRECERIVDALSDLSLLHDGWGAYWRRALLDQGADTGYRRYLLERLDVALWYRVEQAIKAAWPVVRSTEQQQRPA